MALVSVGNERNFLRITASSSPSSAKAVAARHLLFLTLLAFVHRQAYRLPTRRVELYDAFVATMFGSWDRARSLSHTLPRRFEPSAVEQILSSLALEMTIRGHNVVDVDAAGAIVGVAKASDHSDLSSLLSDLAGQSAILTHRGPGNTYLPTWCSRSSSQLRLSLPCEMRTHSPLSLRTTSNRPSSR
jgi:hypothetical protein